MDAMDHAHHTLHPKQEARKEARKESDQRMQEAPAPKESTLLGVLRTYFLDREATVPSASVSWSELKVGKNNNNKHVLQE
eukprot:1195633-Prorocentrum_minimum.AAC.1